MGRSDSLIGFTESGMRQIGHLQTTVSEEGSHRYVHVQQLHDCKN